MVRSNTLSDLYGPATKGRRELARHQPGEHDMDNDRILDLGEDLRNHVFDILDNEIEITGMDAGRIAKIVEEAFVKATQEVMMIELAEADAETKGGDIDSIRPSDRIVPKGWDSI